MKGNEFHKALSPFFVVVAEFCGWPHTEIVNGSLKMWFSLIFLLHIFIVKFSYHPSPAPVFFSDFFICFRVFLVINRKTPASSSADDSLLLPFGRKSFSAVTIRCLHCICSMSFRVLQLRVKSTSLPATRPANSLCHQGILSRTSLRFGSGTGSNRRVFSSCF